MTHATLMSEIKDKNHHAYLADACSELFSRHQSCCSLLSDAFSRAMARAAADETEEMKVEELMRFILDTTGEKFNRSPLFKVLGKFILKNKLMFSFFEFFEFM